MEAFLVISIVVLTSFVVIQRRQINLIWIYLDSLDARAQVEPERPSFVLRLIGDRADSSN